VADITIGVIGTGNMGSALVRGWSRVLRPGWQLVVWDKVPTAVERLASCNGVTVADSPSNLLTDSDIVIIVVKPKDAGDVLGSINPLLREGQVVVSAMAGVDLTQIREWCGPGPALVRVMPNLGVEVGAGTVAVATATGVTPEVERQVVDLFGTLGLVTVVPEGMLDAVTAVSGTGPALLAIAAEGLEDGGVAAGLPRALSRAFARSAMLGLARMLVAGDESADELQQRLVSSEDPLYEGVELLGQRGVRSAYQRSIEVAADRARHMRAVSSGRG
jgi:pyrroline-5-carboxylate reductase